MEIYGIVEDVRGFPVKGATVTRFYPTGEVYSSVIPVGDTGMFNGRVPERDYYWTVSAPGYLTRPVSLENALHDRSDLPMRVTLEADPSLEVIEPVEVYEDVEYNPIAWGVGGATVAAAALWFFGGARARVKMRKIFK